MFQPIYCVLQHMIGLEDEENDAKLVEGMILLPWEERGA